MIATGLDRLLDDPAELAGRRFGLLAHGASVSAEMVPAHLALAAHDATPAVLFGPEHGFYGVEQDMVAAEDAIDPWTEARIVSLYGSDAGSLRPRPEAFDGLDLLVVDLQDVGSRYYTYAATAIWAAEVALARGVEVWLLDRPNPLGGAVVEGNLPRPGYESFVGAFSTPVRHGLTLGELFRLEAGRRGWRDGWRVVEMAGWRRSMLWPQIGRPWLAPSPNMPDFPTALLYPGLCLVEATEISEGRGTTRPFRLIGAPGVDPLALSRALRPLHRFGVRTVPTYFRPWHQKHRGEVCAGVELVVEAPEQVAGYRVGVELLAAFCAVAPEALRWREEPYEFVTDRPALDLLTGGDELRRALEGGGGLEAWVAGWANDESAFRDEREAILVYGDDE